MTVNISPGIVKNGLRVNLDSANDTAFKGIPTTNLTTDPAIFIYNNQGANVNTTLTKTTNTYRGAPIWVATYTPVNQTGANGFSGGFNSGVGIYVDFAIPGGGGLANTWTGYSIFYRANKPLFSTPMYNGYSNVTGYQNPINSSEDLGDGWYKAYVTFFNTTTQSDAKFYAINLDQIAVNETVTVEWAGPFKESRNDSTQYISPYCNGTRGTTVATDGGWPDTSGFDNHGTFNGTPRYNNSNGGSLVFNGTDHFITLNDLGTLSTFSIEGWFNLVSIPGANTFPCIATNTYPGVNNNINFVLGFPDIGAGVFGGGFYNGAWRTTPGFTPLTNTWYHCIFTFNGTTLSLYRNGELFGSTNYTGNPISSTAGVRIGRRWDSAEYINGRIPVVRIYNRALTASEVSQNFNALRGRFGI